MNYLKDSLQTKTVEKVANELKFQVDKAKAKYLTEQSLRLKITVALHINAGVKGQEINEKELTSLISNYISKHGKPKDSKKFFDDLMHGANGYEQSILKEEYNAFNAATTEKDQIDKDKINQLPQFKEIIDARARDALDKTEKDRRELISKSDFFKDLTEPKKSIKPSLFDDEVSPTLKEQDKNLIFQSDKYQKVFADLTTSGKDEPNAQEKTEEQQRHAPSVKELRRNFEMQKRTMGAQNYSSKIPPPKGNQRTVITY